VENHSEERALLSPLLLFPLSSFFSSYKQRGGSRKAASSFLFFSPLFTNATCAERQIEENHPELCPLFFLSFSFFFPLSKIGAGAPGWVIILGRFLPLLPSLFFPFFPSFFGSVKSSSAEACGGTPDRCLGGRSPFLFFFPLPSPWRVISPPFLLPPSFFPLFYLKKRGVTRLDGVLPVFGVYLFSFSFSLLFPPPLHGEKFIRVLHLLFPLPPSPSLFLDDVVCRPGRTTPQGSPFPCSPSPFSLFPRAIGRRQPPRPLPPSPFPSPAGD